MEGKSYYDQSKGFATKAGRYLMAKNDIDFLTDIVHQYWSIISALSCVNHFAQFFLHVSNLAFCKGYECVVNGRTPLLSSQDIHLAPQSYSVCMCVHAKLMAVTKSTYQSDAIDNPFDVWKRKMLRLIERSYQEMLITGQCNTNQSISIIDFPYSATSSIQSISIDNADFCTSKRLRSVDQ